MLRSETVLSQINSKAHDSASNKMGSFMNLLANNFKNSRPKFSFVGLIILCMAIFFPLASHAADAVCAKVKIEIRQELTLERQAFDAMMRINNTLDSIAIENVNISINFKDENGLAVLASSDPNNTTAKVRRAR